MNTNMQSPLATSVNRLSRVIGNTLYELNAEPSPRNTLLAAELRAAFLDATHKASAITGQSVEPPVETALQDASGVVNYEGLLDELEPLVAEVAIYIDACVGNHGVRITKSLATALRWARTSTTAKDTAPLELLWTVFDGTINYLEMSVGSHAQPFIERFLEAMHDIDSTMSKIRRA